MRTISYEAQITADREHRLPQMISDNPYLDQRSSAQLISDHQRLGQVVAEYFILFAVVAVLTLIGFTAFDDDIKTSLEGFVNAAANAIAN